MENLTRALSRVLAATDSATADALADAFTQLAGSLRDRAGQRRAHRAAWQRATATVRRIDAAAPAVADRIAAGTDPAAAIAAEAAARAVPATAIDRTFRAWLRKHKDEARRLRCADALRLAAHGLTDQQIAVAVSARWGTVSARTIRRDLKAVRDRLRSIACGSGSGASPSPRPSGPPPSLHSSLS